MTDYIQIPGSMLDDFESTWRAREADARDFERRIPRQLTAAAILIFVAGVILLLVGKLALGVSLLFTSPAIALMSLVFQFVLRRETRRATKALQVIEDVRRRGGKELPR